MSNPDKWIESTLVGVHIPEGTWVKTQAKMIADTQPRSHRGVTMMVTVALVGLVLASIGGFAALMSMGNNPAPIVPAAGPSESSTDVVISEDIISIPSSEDIINRMMDPDLVWTITNTGKYDHSDRGLVTEQVRLISTFDGSRIRMTHSWNGIAHTDQLIEHTGTQVEVTYLNKEDKTFQIITNDINNPEDSFIYGFGAQLPTKITPALREALVDLVRTGIQSSGTVSIPSSEASWVTGEVHQETGITIFTSEATFEENAIPQAEYSFTVDELPTVYREAGAQSAQLWIDLDTQLPSRLDITFQPSPGRTNEIQEALYWHIRPTGEYQGCSTEPARGTWSEPDYSSPVPQGCTLTTSATFTWDRLSESELETFEIPADYVEQS